VETTGRNKNVINNFFAYKSRESHKNRYFFKTKFLSYDNN